MSGNIGFIRAISCVAMLVAGCTAATAAQETECAQQAQLGVLPAAWNSVREYFAGLPPLTQAGRRAQLIQLRAEIVTLESRKQRLIDILQVHITGATSGVGVSEDLRLSKIPEILSDIQSITGTLEALVRQRDMFAAQDAFKSLRLTLDLKKAVTLCRLQQGSPGPNPVAMQEVVQALSEELRAISTAEDALAQYIRNNP